MSGTAKIELTLPSDLLHRLACVSRSESRDMHGLLIEAVEDLLVKHGPDPKVMEAHRQSIARFGDVYKKLADI
jgi:hypothetical protein